MKRSRDVDRRRRHARFVVNQFWYDADAAARAHDDGGGASGGNNGDAMAQLPPHAAASARTFLKHGAHVRLWLYQVAMSNVPNGVEVCDAASVLPRDEFAAAASRTLVHANGSTNPKYHSVARASDLFRLLMMSERADEWWCDSDVLCVRPMLPAPDEILFASEGVRRTGAYAQREQPTLAAAQAAAAAPTKTDGKRDDDDGDVPWDGRDLFTFCVFYTPRAQHPVLVEAARDVLAHLRTEGDVVRSVGGSNPYTVCMRITYDALTRLGQAHRVAPPLRFSPLLPFHMKRTLFADSIDGFEVFGTRQPSFARILADSWTVQMYTGVRETRDAWARPETVHERSVVRALWRHLGIEPSPSLSAAASSSSSSPAS